MKGLERYPEPWFVEVRQNGWLAVLAANGRIVVAFKHREDLHKIAFTSAEMFLNEKEGLALANAIARLPALERRPQF